MELLRCTSETKFDRLWSFEKNPSKQIFWMIPSKQGDAVDSTNSLIRELKISPHLVSRLNIAAEWDKNTSKTKLRIWFNDVGADNAVAIIRAMDKAFP
jgi:hypothetical protein